jgi:thiamine-monophosphate kinase
VSSLSIKDIGEFDFIEMIKSTTSDDKSVLISIGDDAALIENTKNEQILVTSDLFIEGIDFRFDYFKPSELAYKVLAANISDITAMGGYPRWFTISLGFHHDTNVDFLLDFYKSLGIVSKENQISLIGGDLSDSDKFTISITLLGLIGKGIAIKRNGAKPGDSIWISGGVGFSSLGLFFLIESEKRKFSDLDDEFILYCIDRHKRPPIRSALGQRLARDHIASSMIDISDGLFRDMKHICDMSGVGSLIDMKKLPKVDILKKTSSQVGLDYKNVMSGGEDFELIFTVPPSKEREISLILKEFESLDITQIGSIVEVNHGLKILDLKDEIIDMDDIGYEHFKKEEI